MGIRPTMSIVPMLAGFLKSFLTTLYNDSGDSFLINDQNPCIVL